MKADPEDAADETGKVMPERKIRICPACGTRFASLVAGSVCPVCLLRAAGSSKAPDTASTPEYRLGERGPTGVSRPFENYDLMLDEEGRPIELGRGAMGITYKAFDVDLRCPVTLKVISERYVGDESARRRFLREARAAASLHHSNVASVFHLGRSGTDYFYAMEFVEGETLESLIKRSSHLDAKLALEITTQAACQGISALISTASSTLSRQVGDSIESVDLQGQLALVNAARSSGVGRFVYVSFRDDPTVRYPLTRAKRSVERAIADLDFTSIQASCFMEVWLSPMVRFDYIHGTARIYGTGLKPISWVSYRDVAEFCIAPILRSVAERSVLAVGGPEALTPLEVVKIFEEESGRRFEVETIPEAKLREQFDVANDPLEKSFAGLLLQYAQGETVDMRDLLESIPVRQTSVREYARTVMEPYKRA